MSSKKGYEWRSPDMSVVYRNSDSELSVISGLAVPYDTWTRIHTKQGEMFMERIQRGALKNTLAAGHEIKCLVMHEQRELLGSTRSNLSLIEHKDGLYFELHVNNEKAERMVEGVRTGFFNNCSFEFKKTDWSDEQLGGMTWRTIKAMELYEISLVDSPAYRQTSAHIQGVDVAVLRAIGIGSARACNADILYATQPRHY